jgi:hypothetical protein
MMGDMVDNLYGTLEYNLSAVRYCVTIIVRFTLCCHFRATEVTSRQSEGKSNARESLTKFKTGRGPTPFARRRSRQSEGGIDGTERQNRLFRYNF